MHPPKKKPAKPFATLALVDERKPILAPNNDPGAAPNINETITSPIPISNPIQFVEVANDFRSQLQGEKKLSKSCHE